MRVRCLSGTTFEAAVVVGADGVHSLVRDWLTGGDEPAGVARNVTPPA
jgi:2-polyprenyl-6-methoxyphenol hydroxylase-like FAD-dependent oxidoreductase